MRPLLALPLLLVALAGCTAKDDGALVHNACTEHPNYGTGNPTVQLATTFGNLSVEVFVDKVPNTGMNFVKLAEQGHFNSSTFHRIISNFMMQGGDYTMGNGQGGAAHPDCDIGDGNIVDEYREDLRHSGKGTLSMANTGHAESGGSQFFITFTATPHLDAYDANGDKKECGALDQFGRPKVSCHAVFGRVTAGTEVLDAINQAATAHDAAEASKPPNQRVTYSTQFVSASVTWPAA